MKNPLAVSSVLLVYGLFSIGAAAEPDSTAISELSPYDQICLAAMKSKAEVNARRVELKIGRNELRKIRCNDYSVIEFAKLHSEIRENWSIATVQ